ncbi:MAG: hypothetical protein AB7Q29_01125 [Vicinamibacterales bacterium]
MGCSSSCEFVRWRVEAVRFTQRDTRYMEFQLHGGVWTEVEIAPPPGPTPEADIPSTIAAIKHLVTSNHGLTDENGRCESCGESACRCVRTGKYARVLTWSTPGSFPLYIPPLGGQQFWICRIDYEATVTKYRASGECVPASLPGRQVDAPDDGD